MLRPEIFDYLSEGEDLVDDAFVRLVAEGRVIGHRHTGFWHSADTLKERAQLEQLFHSGEKPWALWDASRFSASPHTPTGAGPRSGAGVQWALRDVELR